MANNQNLLKGKATQFTSENQPENRGRKPSALRFIRDQGMSITDIKKIIGSLIWDYDSAELADLLSTVNVKEKDENGKTKTVKRPKEPLPMGINLVLGALAEDLKTKSIANFERLMDRTYGRPTQKDIIEFSDIPDTTKERLNAIFNGTKKTSEKITPKNVVKKGSLKEKRKGKNEG